MRRRRLLTTPVVAGVAVALAAGSAWAAGAGHNTPLGQNKVGRLGDGSVLTAENKYVTPAGTTIEQTGQPMDTALRPDGRTAVSLTKSGLGLFTVVDLSTKKVLQQYTPPKGTGSADIGTGGLLYSPDGKTLYAAQTKDVLKFTVGTDGTLSAPTVIAMPTTGAGSTPTNASGTPATPLPTDLAWTSDGKIVVVLDGFNSVGILDPATNTVSKQTLVGVAPRDVAVIGTHAFVSNEAGRQPTATDFTNLSYDSPAVAEQRDGRASTGTVSEIDLATNTVVHTYDVGLDPSSMVVHGNDLLVTNSSDDTVSVIDTAAQAVTQTVNVNPLPGQPYGSSPNSLTFLDDTHFAVSLGRDNAVAVYGWSGSHKAVAFSGLIPTAWYPGTLIMNPVTGRLLVANLKGVGALAGDGTISEGPGTNPATDKQVYKDEGVIEQVDPPGQSQISQYTSQVFANNQWNGLASRNPVASGKKAAAVAIPKRIGDPSKIKHVFVIVEENRTYDQILGDDPRGNGDAANAQFGKTVTPNAHAEAKRFPLIDNLYSDGTNSASGHTWLDAAFVNDYLERSYANYVRDYGQPDAMVYPKSGFLWDNARAHGLSTKVWGEYAEYFTAPNGTAAQGTWSQWYHDSQVLEGKAKGPLHAPLGYYQTKSDVPSLDKLLDRRFPNFQTNIPDQYRVDLFSQDFKKYEQNGKLPALNMLWVMCNHTSGTNAGLPTPAAQVADNDLAVGRMIDQISHSKYWKDSAIFVVQDDSQNGVDHVDGHRAPVVIASPYTKTGSVDHTYYTQLNVTRTVEQILGLPPMNQLDLAAEPMRNSFTNTPNLKPYTHLANNIPLDTLNPSAAQAKSPMQKAWLTWSESQDFGTEDQSAFAPMNRLLWYSSTGYTKPYPGDRTVMTPQQVQALFPQAAPAESDASDIPGAEPKIRALQPHTAGVGTR